MKSLLTTTASLVMIALAGCATLTEGTTQLLEVDTPGVADAHCVLLREYAEPVNFNAPGEVSVYRGSSVLTVECQKEGYEVSKVTIEPAVTSRTQLPLGYVVDMMSGARYHYPASVKVVMAPLH